MLAKLRAQIEAFEKIHGGRNVEARRLFNVAHTQERIRRGSPPPSKSAFRGGEHEDSSESAQGGSGVEYETSEEVDIDYLAEELANQQVFLIKQQLDILCRAMRMNYSIDQYKNVILQLGIAILVYWNSPHTNEATRFTVTEFLVLYLDKLNYFNQLATPLFDEPVGLDMEAKLHDLLQVLSDRHTQFQGGLKQKIDTFLGGGRSTLRKTTRQQVAKGRHPNPNKRPSIEEIKQRQQLERMRQQAAVQQAVVARPAPSKVVVDRSKRKARSGNSGALDPKQSRTGARQAGRVDQEIRRQRAEEAAAAAEQAVRRQQAEEQEEIRRRQAEEQAKEEVRRQQAEDQAKEEEVAHYHDHPVQSVQDEPKPVDRPLVIRRVLRPVPPDNSSVPDNSSGSSIPHPQEKEDACSQCVKNLVGVAPRPHTRECRCTVGSTAMMMAFSCVVMSVATFWYTNHLELHGAGGTVARLTFSELMGNYVDSVEPLSGDLTAYGENVATAAQTSTAGENAAAWYQDRVEVGVQDIVHGLGLTIVDLWQHGGDSWASTLIKTFLPADTALQVNRARLLSGGILIASLASNIMGVVSCLIPSCVRNKLRAGVHGVASAGAVGLVGFEILKITTWGFACCLRQATLAAPATHAEMLRQLEPMVIELVSNETYFIRNHTVPEVYFKMQHVLLRLQDNPRVLDEMNLSSEARDLVQTANAQIVTSIQTLVTNIVPRAIDESADRVGYLHGAIEGFPELPKNFERSQDREGMWHTIFNSPPDTVVVSNKDTLVQGAAVEDITDNRNDNMLDTVFKSLRNTFDGANTAIYENIAQNVPYPGEFIDFETNIVQRGLDHVDSGSYTWQAIWLLLTLLVLFGGSAVTYGAARLAFRGT